MPYRDTLGVCPRCGSPIGGGWDASGERLECASCQGRFVGFSSLPGSLPGLMEWLGNRPSQVPTEPLGCPRCSLPMRALTLGAASVTLDFCASHGVWFDSSELEQLARSLKAG